MKVFGLGLLRNAIKYDYCFRESLLSLGRLVEKIYLALGDSEDETNDEVAKIPVPMELIDSPWDPQMMGKGGTILSAQTNIALEKLRQAQGHRLNAWGLYLQADEVIHEEDYDLIEKDLQRAQDRGCDAISFRYLHFWQTHHHIVITKRWYPAEIRAIKLNSPIVSWGDAQSFQNVQKLFHSEARIFHYGHVRKADRYEMKKKDMHKLYSSNPKTLASMLKKAKKNDAKGEFLRYFGTHPEIMKERILSMGDPFELEEKEEVWIVGNEGDYCPSFLKRIKAGKIHWVSSIGQLKWKDRFRAVITSPTLLKRLLYGSRVPLKARSPLALPWNKEFLLTLQLSERGIGLRKRENP